MLRRIAVLKGERFAARLARQLADLRLLALGGQTPADGAGAGGTPGGDRAAELLGRWTRRMHDVSEFAKTFKELVDIEYKAFRRQEDGKAYCGSLWAGRFKSTLIEDGKYLTTCVRYVELNPVRARMTKQAWNYAYCSAADEEQTKGRRVCPQGVPWSRPTTVGATPERRSPAPGDDASARPRSVSVAVMGGAEGRPQASHSRMHGPKFPHSHPIAAVEQALEVRVV